MKYKVHIVRKSVKHLRIRVVDTSTVLATAPKRMSQEKILSFIKTKESWIEKHLKSFANAENYFEIGDNQLLLHGEAYTPLYREGQGKRYTVDHKTKFIRWGYDLKNEKQKLHRYKTYAKHYLTGRLEQISEQHNLAYNKLFVRDQKTKRGTCSSERNIGLNWKLIKAPLRIMDYVICHELAHLAHMNHSQEFRDECIRLFPKTNEAKLWLKKYGKSLH